MHLLPTLLITIFFCSEFVLPVDCKYGYGRYNSYTTPTSLNYVENLRGKPSRGVGISAWGIVFLIVMFILVGIGIYYAAVFYPLLCKKERKYDRIELATV